MKLLYIEKLCMIWMMWDDSNDDDRFESHHLMWLKVYQRVTVYLRLEMYLRWQLDCPILQNQNIDWYRIVMFVCLLHDLWYIIVTWIVEPRASFTSCCLYLFSNVFAFGIEFCCIWESLVDLVAVDNRHICFVFKQYLPLFYSNDSNLSRLQCIRRDAVHSNPKSSWGKTYAI